MDQNSALQMMQMMTGGVVAQSISVAAELGIADQLAGGGKSSSQLAALVNADEQKLRRLLRFLASVGIFQLDSAEEWQLTPLAGLLRSDAPQSVRAGARMFGRISAAFPHMTENVRTGKRAYSLEYGKSLFEDLLDRPEDAAIFDAGHVLQRTAAGLEDRGELLAGSFFEAIPAGADAYSMRHIVHDWTDDLCVRILANIRKVIPAHGRFPTAWSEPKRSIANCSRPPGSPCTASRRRSPRFL